MVQYGTWSPYQGSSAFLLGLALFVIGCVLTYLGSRQHSPIGVGQPGKFVSVLLLTLSPLTKISRYTLFTLAGMFFVFSIWALSGFSYPSSPIPAALNAVSKILCFLTAITLFLPQTGTTADLKI